MTYKDETSDFFTKKCRKVQNEKGYSITSIRTIMEENLIVNFLKYFVTKMVWIIIFSALRTPQQNGFIEMKNRVF